MPPIPCPKIAPAMAPGVMAGPDSVFDAADSSLKAVTQLDSLSLPIPKAT
jgi:hypothetical protein